MSIDRYLFLTAKACDVCLRTVFEVDPRGLCRRCARLIPAAPVLEEVLP